MRVIALALALLSVTTNATPRQAWVAIGDSITYGYSHNANPYPKRLATLLGVKVANMGIGGDVAANINTQITNHILTFRYKVVIIEECINDLIAGTAGATCWTATDAAVDAAVAAGLTVVLMTAVPCGNYAGWNGTKEIERDAYNTSVRAKAASNPSRIKLIDLDTIISDDGNTIKAAHDSGDGLHPDGDGMQAIADYAATLTI
jgi:lysophospholipase L1-like esterase